MTLKDIYALMEKFESSDIASLELEMDDTKLKLDKASTVQVIPTASPAAVAPAAAIEAAPAAPMDEKYIKAPLVGTFYTSPAPGEEPYAKVGQKISKGQTVCLIEAMKMINEIPAPCDCIIEKILLNNEDAVAFDTPIFVIKEL